MNASRPATVPRPSQPIPAAALEAADLDRWLLERRMLTDAVWHPDALACFDTAGVTPDAFVAAEHRAAFAAVCRLASCGVDLTAQPKAVAAEVKKSGGVPGVPPSVGLTLYLHRVALPPRDTDLRRHPSWPSSSDPEGDAWWLLTLARFPVAA